MKLNRLSDAVAEACDVRAKLVAAVQKETFRQLRATVENGERVQIPDFGVFVGRDAEDESGKKMLRFRPAPPAQNGGGEGENEEAKSTKAGRAAKREVGSAKPAKTGKRQRQTAESRPSETAAAGPAKGEPGAPSLPDK